MVELTSETKAARISVTTARVNGTDRRAMTPMNSPVSQFAFSNVNYYDRSSVAFSYAKLMIVTPSVSIQCMAAHVASPVFVNVPCASER